MHRLFDRLAQGVESVRHPKPPTRTDLFSQMIAHWEYAMIRLFRQHKIGAYVVDRIRGPQLFTFRLALYDPADLAKILGLAEQVSLVMHVDSVKLGRSRGIIEVQVALHRSLTRRLMARHLNLKGGLWATLGQTPAGQPVHINLVGVRTCHAQIVGTTGSGKTMTQQLIAWQLTRHNPPEKLRIILIDAKGDTSWYGFDRIPHLQHPILRDAGDAAGALAWLLVEMERRKREQNCEPHIFLIVDETKHLLDLGRDTIGLAIQRIAEIGRGLGVHVNVATQHATAASIGGGIVKANLPLKITGRVLTGHAAALATGVKASGAEELRGNGDFLITVAGNTRRVQIAMVGRPDFRQMPTCETPNKIDLYEYSLDRVLGLVDDEPGDNGLDVEAVAFAMVKKNDGQLPGVPAIREKCGPMGTPRAQRVRDYARRLRDELASQGYYPLPLTGLSPETARRVGIDLEE